MEGCTADEDRLKRLCEKTKEGIGSMPIDRQ